MKALRPFSALLIILGLFLALPANAQPIVPYGAVIPTGVYVQTITPAISSAAIQTAEQTFTVSGITTNDKIVVIPPAPTSLCPMIGARVSAANTIALQFSTLTAVACTPAAGSYTIVAFRVGG